MISFPTLVSSFTAMTDNNADALITLLNSLVKAGIILCNAWGIRIRRRMFTSVIPMDWAASFCPLSIDSIAARTI